MKSTIAIFLLNLLSNINIIDGQTCLSEPAELEWSTSTGENTATITFDAKSFDATEFNLPIGFTTRVHNSQLPSPTIRFKRDETYHITLINNLDPVLGTINNPTQHNQMKDVNVTNLHTHGVHISGESPADDVFDYIDGGDSMTYVYNIACDHAGGSFWYHPHHHGSTTIQVGGGAVGAIIVEDDATAEGLPDWLTQMNEFILIIQHVDLQAIATFGAGIDDLFTIHEPTNGQPINDFWLLNGQYQPNICLEAGIWTRIRIIHADIALRNEFSIDNQDLNAPADQQCEIYLISRDGVLIHGSDNTVPRPLTTRRLYFSTASRADIAIRCNVAGIHTITNNQGTVIGYIDVTTPAQIPQEISLTSFNPIRPAYLQSLLTAVPDQQETITVAAATPPDTGFAINGLKFAGDPSDPEFEEASYVAVMQSGTIQEWRLAGGRGNRAHPIHIHINHFQVVQDGITGTDPNWTHIGDWLDVLDTDGTVRFYTDRFGGKVVIHCHILEHEDEGTMAVAFIVGGCGAGDCPISDENCVSVPTTTETVTTTATTTTTTTETPTTTATTGTSIICVAPGQPCVVDTDCCQNLGQTQCRNGRTCRFIQLFP